MINNDWERFGDEIRRTIQDAVDSRDFSRLNQTVSDTIGKAMDSVSRGMKNGGWYREEKARTGAAGVNMESVFGRSARRRPGGRYADGRQADGQSGPQADSRGGAAGDAAERPAGKMLYLKGTSTWVGGLCLAATGYVFAAGFLVLLLFLAFGAAADGWTAGLKVGMGAFGLATLLFLGMGVTGTHMARMVGRFREYVRILKDREYCDVKELSQRTGRSAKALVKDLRKMIGKGWFLQGHLDEQGTCLMTSEEAYEQYTRLMDRMEQEKAEREAAAEQRRKEYEGLSPELQNIVRAGDEYVKKIREANDAIPGEEISAKISRMEMLVDRIFDRVEDHPESVGDIRKLMEYYLPITIKLLDAYEELDAQPVQGENILSSKKEIEETIDTLNVAFEKLLDDLFQETAWDLSSDISVLETMLAQEGLTEDGLKNPGGKA